MKILISAGPTRETIDPARFISNRSSGKMGYALASAAAELGHETTLISGPVSLVAPDEIAIFQVISAADMARKIHQHAPDADLIIMAAAVADYRPKSSVAEKLKKTSDPLILELERTEDILAALGKNKPAGQILVGFAAESSDLVAHAETKLREKNCDWMIANDISRDDRGFDKNQNAVTMLARDGRRIDLPLMEKTVLAVQILQAILD